MTEAQYFLVGWNGKVTRYKHDAPPHAIVCFPKHSNENFIFPLFLDKYNWCREITESEYEEFMAWGMFSIEPWTNYCESGGWFRHVAEHSRATWEVMPDVPNIRDYGFLDHKEPPRSLRWFGDKCIELDFDYV